MRWPTTLRKASRHSSKNAPPAGPANSASHFRAATGRERFSLPPVNNRSPRPPYFPIASQPLLQIRKIRNRQRGIERSESIHNPSRRGPQQLPPILSRPLRRDHF